MRYLYLINEYLRLTIFLKTMQKLLIIMLLVITTNVFSQPKTVIITQYPQKVPTGKRWVLSSDVQTKIQVSEGTLNSGTFCNSMFLSNPHIIYNINRSDVTKTESFGIIFKGLEKVPYTNDITFTITPTAIIDKNFSLSQLQYSSPEHIGQREIYFNAGESVFVSNCLESIEVREIDLSITPNSTLNNNSVSIKSSSNGAGNSGLQGIPNRSFLIKPIIENIDHRIGKIVVSIKVDKIGNIVSATAGARGTTIVDPNLYKRCEQSLLSSKLTPLNDAPDIQFGYFVFILK
jgi:hypothetical protein